ncbi:MFS transporter [Pseudomonas sp. L5B5]|uniref:MFS transporter n=1 Tax=Pseudomonas sp. L5B5 TaxID=2883205 RepID=UPI001CFB1854|nr:MFS transporter [Pseudomonas sp. L5B5]UCZ84720.1 MFS transporter [Pseudomonas sp. L5B5]
MSTLTASALSIVRSRPSLRLLAVILFSSIGPLVLLTAPALVSRYIVELGMDNRQVGWLFSLELGAMALSTLPTYLWMRRYDWRWIAGLAAALFLLGNLLTALLMNSPAPGFIPLTALRFSTAFAEAALVLVCLGTAGTLSNATRAFGLWVTGQLVLAALCLQLMPWLFSHWGLSSFFLLIAVFTALILPLVLSLPAGSQDDTQPLPPHQARGVFLKVGRGMLAIFLFYLSLSGIWTFAGELARLQGIAVDDSASALATASLMGVAGAAMTSWIGARGQRAWLLALGYLAMTAGLFGLLGEVSSWRYLLAACAFKFAWTFALPFLLSAISDYDRQGGKLVVLANLAICGGLAVGPSLAAWLLGDTLDFRVLLLASAAICALSFLAILPLARQQPPK